MKVPQNNAIRTQALFALQSSTDRFASQNTALQWRTKIGIAHYLGMSTRASDHAEQSIQHKRNSADTINLQRYPLCTLGTIFIRLKSSKLKYSSPIRWAAIRLTKCSPCARSFISECVTRHMLLGRIHLLSSKHVLAETIGFFSNIVHIFVRAIGDDNRTIGVGMLCLQCFNVDRRSEMSPVTGSRCWGVIQNGVVHG
ncbi:uncharacterized protein BDV17DRAFT_151057 [Aspergillus undulatus]|uniref:uncharacterized protein n=1 Tax=Aspergillus undulatus TaxID=1810928 RepID=UPI003CCD16DA